MQKEVEVAKKRMKPVMFLTMKLVQHSSEELERAVLQLIFKVLGGGGCYFIAWVGEVATGWVGYGWEGDWVVERDDPIPRLGQQF